MMKNWKLAAGLGAILIFLGALATWDETKTTQEEKEKTTKNLLVSLKTEDIVGITFHSTGDAVAGGDKAPSNPKELTKVVDVTIKLVDGKWQLTAPVSEPADQQVAQDLIKNVVEYKFESEVEKGKDKWVKFGLADPRRRVEFESKDGSKMTIFVGINAPVGFSTYIATDKSEAIYAGSQYIGTSLGKTLFDFRDKKILKVASTDITSLKINRGKEAPLEMSKSDGKWAIVSPEKVEGDTVQVNNLLDDITSLKAAEFLDAPSAEIAASFGPTKVFASISLGDSKGASQTILIADVKGTLYGSKDPQKLLFKLPEDTRGKIAKTLNDLRNKKILNFQSSSVETVEIDGKKFGRVKDDWYALEDTAKFDKDGKFIGKESDKASVQSHVRGLLVDLEFAKAESVLELGSETAKKLPESPKHRIHLSFSTSSKQIPMTIDVWLAGDNPEMIFIKFTGGKSLYKAKRTVISSLSEKTAVLPAGDSPPTAEEGFPQKG